MTTTNYRVESHDYTENTPCDNPQTCTNPKHWGSYHTSEAKTLEQARDAVEMDDAPAVRIIEVTRTETRKVVAG